MLLSENDLVIGRKFASYVNRTLTGMQRKYAVKEAKHYDMYRRLLEKKCEETTRKNGIYIDEEQGFAAVEINDLLNSLTEMQRKIIELTVIQQFSEGYVAKEMNISQQRVNKIKLSAIDALRKELNGEL